METGRMQRMAVCEDWQSAGVAGKGCCVWRLAECRGCLSVKAGKG